MTKQAGGSTGWPAPLRSGATVNKSLLNKPKRWLEDYKWPLVGLMWIAAIILGYEGFSKHSLVTGEVRSFWDNLYRAIQLFTFESGAVPGPVPWELQVSRLLAPALAIYTALQALAIILREQFQLLRLRFMKNHVVICGLGRKGLLLSKEFRQRGERVVVIEEDEGNELLECCRELGIIVLIGNATNVALLRQAQVHKAKCLVSICGNDGTNAEVAVDVRQLVSRRKGRALSCLVHFFDLPLYNLLREQEFGMGKLDIFRLEFFNVFESGARALLNEYPPFGITGNGDKARPHILVVGIGRLGESLVVNAARKWHDLKDRYSERLRITLIDRYADAKKESLCLRYPQLERVCELSASAIDINAPDFERAEFLFGPDGNCDVTMVYVCLDDDSKALGAALTLNQRIRPIQIPIVVRMTQDAGLATLLPENKDKRDTFTGLHAFGLLDRTCTPDLISGCTYEILARSIHEDYVLREEARGFTSETNPSVVPWQDLPDSLKDSNSRQAEHIRTKLRAIGCDIAVTTDWDVEHFEFSPAEVELMARMEHDRFMAERLQEGFKYGPTKDPKRKTSPTLIPWDELAVEEQEKDRQAVQSLSSLLARARFQIYRLRTTY